MKTKGEKELALGQVTGSFRCFFPNKPFKFYDHAKRTRHT
jgi:hypothetical protein